MYNLNVYIGQIQESLFKVLKCYGKSDETRLFIKKWLQMLYCYTSDRDFITFEPNPPVLSTLVPNAVAIMVIPYSSSKIPFRFRYLSIFPLFPFRIQMKHTDMPCQNQSDFLKLYIKLSGIRMIGFHSMTFQERSISEQLKKEFPYLKIYLSRSIYDFKRKLVRFKPEAAFSRDLKCQSLPSTPSDTASQSAAPVSNPTNIDSV